MTRARPWLLLLLLATSRHPYTRPLIILASIFRNTFLRVLSFLHLSPISSISPPGSLCNKNTHTHPHSLSLSLSRAVQCDESYSATRQQRHNKGRRHNLKPVALFFLLKQGRCCPSSVSMGADFNNHIPLILNLRFFIHNP
jgi:hypothetical protein